jgi:hypothetical protein
MITDTLDVPIDFRGDDDDWISQWVLLQSKILDTYPGQKVRIKVTREK